MADLFSTILLVGASHSLTLPASEITAPARCEVSVVQTLAERRPVGLSETGFHGRMVITRTIGRVPEGTNIFMIRNGCSEPLGQSGNLTA
ncbi:hypothetical protein DQ384_04880 [Sphaerisporangium album]|uniref:Uncharacterized protein n=1 Tax=Sphaerisporangium album TaxID=509200 RepID=A0A367FQX0_9ACTN|nr:hypothetical protein DQ384_04880 [Sphaerisporangium album]